MGIRWHSWAEWHILTCTHTCKCTCTVYIQYSTGGRVHACSMQNVVGSSPARGSSFFFENNCLGRVVIRDTCMYISCPFHVSFMNVSCIFHVHFMHISSSMYMYMCIFHVHFIIHVHVYFITYISCIFHVPDISHHVQVFQLAHLQCCSGVRGQYWCVVDRSQFSGVYPDGGGSVLHHDTPPQWYSGVGCGLRLSVHANTWTEGERVKYRVQK